MSAKHLQRFLRRLHKKPSWQVHKGYGSSLIFEFGEPELKIWKPVLRPNKAGRKYPERMAYVTGDWHLWIFCCDWEIRQERRKICHSKSADKRINQACAVLNGQILRMILVEPATAKTDFHFDLGGQLRTTP